MGYVILRTQKLKSGQAIRRSLTHAFREQDTPNADPERIAQNTHFGGVKSASEALAKVNARLNSQAKIRSNAVLAIEYLVTASPEDMKGKTRAEQDAYFRDAGAWLVRKHGAENVVYAGIHRDEISPHMYAYVVPIDQRGKLNCRAFLGGAKALTEMQTDFAETVGRKHGLERGIEGSRAKHTRVSQYYARANAAFEPLPTVKTPAPKPMPEPEKPGVFASGEEKQAYQVQLKAWEAAQRQRQQHQVEVKAQRDVAVETARRHEAQALEAEALRREVARLKAENGKLQTGHRKAKDTIDRLNAAGKNLVGIVKALSPDELALVQERQRMAAEAAQRGPQEAQVTAPRKGAGPKL